MRFRERVAAFFWNIVDPVLDWFSVRAARIREIENDWNGDGDGVGHPATDENRNAATTGSEPER